MESGGRIVIQAKHVNIQPSGRRTDLEGGERGEKSSKGMTPTPKPYGKRKTVGVIRDGEYVDPRTGKPIKLSNKPLRDFNTVHINKIGGLE